MAYIDPRANPAVGTEFVSGQITDKALALLDILNQVTGTKGKSVREIEAINHDGSISNLTLGAYDIEADYDAKAWETSQRVYFQSTPQRLALIQKTLQKNLEQIQKDIASPDNIKILFDIIQKGGSGNLDIEGQLNTAEGIFAAATGEDILSEDSKLKDEISRLLTSDAALDAIMTAFMNKFILDVNKLDDKIFNLLDDHDSNFSSDRNGKDTTDAAAAKYIVIGKDLPTIITDNITDVFNAVFKAPYEADRGAGSWTDDTERTILYNFTNNNFQRGALSLNPGLINKIIEDKEISDDDLKKISKQSQFLEKYNFEEFVNLAASYYGTSGDRDATIKKLSLDHLEAITPKYFEDQRTLQDILAGKGNNSDTSNINRVFQSAGDQIKEAASGAIELLGSGFDKLSRNNFEGFVRNNPILAIDHLETKKASLTDPQEIASVNDQIAKLVEFNKRELGSLIQWYTEKNKRLNDTDAIAHNKEILNILQGPEGILSKLNSYNGSSSVTEIIGLYNGSAELKLETLDDGETFNGAALAKIIESGLKIQNAHKALYANEMLESGKLNANYSGKELAKPGQDGTIPEDKQIAPPTISPTISSGIIAVIGNEMLYKANSLLNNPEVPDKTWVDKNATILKDINDKLPGLTDGTTAGKVFLDNLKKVFREAIKQFVTSDVQSSKNSVDAAKQTLSDNQSAIRSQCVLDQNDSDANLSDRDITDFDNIHHNLSNLTHGISGNIFDNDNFIKKAGLKKSKEYLENLIDRLDDIDYDSRRTITTLNITTTNIAIVAKTSQLAAEQALPEPDSERISNLENEIEDLTRNLVNHNRQLTNLNTQEDLLDRADHLLNAEGKIKRQFNRLVSDVNRALAGHSLGPTENTLDFLNNNRPTLLTNYKTTLTAYSNRLTDHFNDNTDPLNDIDGVITTDIEQKFRNALVDTSLDLNQDGINDFKNIQNIVDKVGDLGDNVANVFGTDAAQEGNIRNQNIKRLILMMFAMSILEYSDWEYNKSEADLSRYAVPE